MASSINCNAQLEWKEKFGNGSSDKFSRHCEILRIPENPPGSKETGHTKNLKTLEPVTWHQLDSLVDGGSEFARGNPRGYLNKMSVTNADYQQILTGHERIQALSLTAKRIAGGFTTNKERFCCYLADKAQPNRPFDYDCTDFYTTSYTIDYPIRRGYCDLRGKKIVGEGFKFGVEDSLQLFYGRYPSYITETRERFYNPFPQGKERAGPTLQGGVLKTKSSAYVKSITPTAAWQKPIDDCMSPTNFEQLKIGLIDPQRYNAFERFVEGHKTFIQKNYRPSPTGPDLCS